MGMSFAYGPADQDEATAFLHHALDQGVNLLDTADMYGGGDNERLLAGVLKDRPDEVVLATKFGIVTDPETGFPNGTNGSPEYLRKAVDDSLQRLGVDVIDLYYLHRVDPTRPIEETVEAMAELVVAGKVRDDVVPIPGTKRRTYLDENIGALNVVLSTEQLARLSALRAVGDRTPDMAWVAGRSA